MTFRPHPNPGTVEYPPLELARTNKLPCGRSGSTESIPENGDSFVFRMIVMSLPRCIVDEFAKMYCEMNGLEL